MANRTDLITKVKKQLNLDKKGATEVVDTVLESIEDLTIEDGKLQIIGHGNYEIRERAARKGRNPQTGEEIDIAASKIPAFKPSKAFKEKAN
ncbi:HU family DNA-binding protein [Heyndrickxia oleronia]|uniref:HU family DNA-binding protein n=1 Tax=Heyndrickxia oleronia TaxID=38875 RepID=UPI003F20782F